MYMCEETFGGCMWSFSWLGQKVQMYVVVQIRSVRISRLSGVYFRFNARGAGGSGSRKSHRPR